jgi:putative glutamine amidotransferase
MIGPHPFHMQGEKYLAAVAHGAGGDPVGLPCLGEGFDVLNLLPSLDGLLMTGSPSNVEPHHYLGPASREGTLHDEARDSSALALIPAAIGAGLPLLAICRGLQELNVAFGGTLHQEVHSVPGLLMHREDKGAPLEVQYGPSHEVRFAAGGMLERITGQTTARVNSLHAQGIDRPGTGLVVEARAEDGLIEAVTVADAPGFVLAVQWHPEWRVRENPVYLSIFQAFGDACRTYQRS